MGKSQLEYSHVVKTEQQAFHQHLISIHTSNPELAGSPALCSLQGSSRCAHVDTCKAASNYAQELHLLRLGSVLHQRAELAQ